MFYKLAFYTYFVHTGKISLIGIICTHIPVTVQTATNLLCTGDTSIDIVALLGLSAQHMVSLYIGRQFKHSRHLISYCS